MMILLNQNFKNVNQNDPKTIQPNTSKLKKIKDKKENDLIE